MVEDRLRKIIDKYGENRTNYAIAKKMAEITLEEDGNNFGDKNHKDALIKKINGYKSNLYYYKSGKKKPKAETLLLMSQAIGCKREELEAIFYPQNSTPENHNDQVVEATGFKLLEVASTHIYFDDGRLEWSSSFKIECLEENLQTLKELDFYDCPGETVQVNCQDERFYLERDRDNRYKDNFISAQFHKPLKKGEQVDLTINYSCNKVHSTGCTFGTCWVLHPTDLLRIDYTPPNQRGNMQAKMYKHDNRGSFLGLGYDGRTELGNISLSEECSFKTEIQDPCLYALYEIYWG